MSIGSDQRSISSDQRTISSDQHSISSDQRTISSDQHSISCDQRTIGAGFVVLLGICEEDSMEDVEWLVKKIVNLRVFDDENGVMNRSILDTGGDCLVVSQFTLFASYKKGNRPSWLRAARHEISIPLYEAFCRRLQEALRREVKTGEFGANMLVSIENDGPVTIYMDTKNKE